MLLAVIISTVIYSILIIYSFLIIHKELKNISNDFKNIIDEEEEMEELGKTIAATD
jgi:hypothetical protein